MRLLISICFLLFSFAIFAQYPINEDLLQDIDSLMQDSAIADQHEAEQTDTLKRNRIWIDITKPNYMPMSREKIVELIHRSPSFGMFKDNYFITGIPLNKKINSQTADVKFQISIRQRLIKRALPFNSFLMLTYTQKSFWTAYGDSSPFKDNNYNPGLSFTTPIIINNLLRGVTVISLEHESNGWDGDKSRSWNYVAVSGTYFFNDILSGQLKIWPGRVDKEYTADLFKYRGYGLIALNYRSPKDWIWGSVIINPRDRFRAYNIMLELNFRFNKNFNQYLFFQYYDGYGEGLMNYNKYSSMIRAGVCIKPPLRNFY